MDGWQVIKKLGEGGSGAVYLVRTPEGKAVALKILTVSQSHQRSLFEKEASLLMRLRHPAIASVLGFLADSREIFGDNRGPCFWMELVEGQDLFKAASEASDRQIFEWFGQALEALRYLHAQGVLHGDLSPGNVRIDAVGRLKLLDFGFASVMGADGGPRAGTVLYLAPERISGRATPASDLFSLGTLFYEALAGEHPRASCRSLREMTTREAKPLLQVVPRLAAEHAIGARVIDRMIRASAAERFPGAAEALAALDGAKADEAVSKAPSGRYHARTFFGAEEFFVTVEHAISALPERSEFFAVHGPTGVGKTRFLREALFQCAFAGLPVREYSANDFLRGLREATAPTGEARVWVFHSLDQVRVEDLAPLARLRRSSFAAFGSLVFFEWNDDRLHEDARRLLQAMPLANSLQEIPLANLSPEQTKALLSGALGEEATGDVFDVAWEKAAGNPLMLIEFVEVLRSKGFAAKRHLSQESKRSLDRLDSMQEILKQRVSALEPKEREVLLLLAVAHFPSGLEELLLASGNLFGVPPDEAVFQILPLLESLKELGLVRLDEGMGRYGLGFSSLEPAILGGVSGERLRDLHRVWFEALGSERSAQKIHHALELDEKEAVVQGAREAVEFLWKHGRPDEALGLLRRAFKAVSENPEETSRLLRIQVNILNDLGRYEEALQTLEKIFALKANDEPLSVKTLKYWLIQGLIRQNLGQSVEAERLFGKALKEAKDFDGPEIEPYLVKIHSALGLHYLNAGKLSQAKASLEEGLRIHTAKDHRRAEICRYLAVVLSKEGNAAEADRLLDEAKALYQADRFFSGEFAVWLEKGNLAVHRGDADLAEEQYGEAEKIAQSHKDDLMLALLWHNRGVLARKKGDLAIALAQFERALEVLRPLGHVGDLVDGLLEHVVTEAEVGRFARASQEIREMRRFEEALPSVREKIEEAENFLREYRDGDYLPLKEKPGTASWNVEAALRESVRAAEDPQFIRKTLSKIYDGLPASLQVSFIDRADYKQWIIQSSPRGG